MSTAARDSDPTRVRFPADFAQRLERLAARLAAARTRGLGPGRSALTGAGQEFVGHRPYQPGEELRHLDWNLLARLERPFVRVHQRDAGERWALVLDTSASMGLGHPGKLQLAAEVACGVACSAARAGTDSTLYAAVGDETQRRVHRRPADLAGWLAFLSTLTASGDRGVRDVLRDGRLRAANRIVLVGDLFDLEPRDVLPLAGPGRELVLIQLLAPHELVPGELGDEVRWLDPETGERLDVALDRGVSEGYERALEHRLESWRRIASRHRVAHACWSSATPFEEVVEAALAP